MKHLGLICLCVAAAWTMPAQAGEVNTGYFGNVAIEGYDTVAYFTEKRAVKGSEKFQSEWLGATWQFSSDENRKLFDASPMDYAPQYGGLCSEGVAYQRDDGQHRTGGLADHRRQALSFRRRGLRGPCRKSAQGGHQLAGRACRAAEIEHAILRRNSEACRAEPARSPGRRSCPHRPRRIASDRGSSPRTAGRAGRSQFAPAQSEKCLAPR